MKGQAAGILRGAQFCDFLEVILQGFIRQNYIYVYIYMYIYICILCCGS